MAPTGQVIGLQGIFWDITQQRLADEKIRRVNALLAQSRKELRAKNAQMEDDLKMAREIQLTMLPQQYPDLPALGLAVPKAPSNSRTAICPPAPSAATSSPSPRFPKDEAGVFICDVAGMVSARRWSRP